MTYTPTDRPVPSDAPEDLYFNSDLIDRYANGPAGVPVIDRTGEPRKSWATIEAENASLAGNLLSSEGTDYVRYGNRLLTERLEDAPSIRDYITTPIDGTTSNQVGVVAAAAANQGSTILVPPGTYVLTDSVPGFHNVRWVGDGVFKRGADTFKCSQRGGQTNTIYCSASGSASNDGLTSDKPVNTLQNALNVLVNYGPMLPGTWVIRLAGGPQGGGVTVPDNLGSEVRVQILGPAVGASPAVPTAIFDGGGIQSFGITVNDSAKLLLRDIKFQNFLDYGVNNQDLGDILYINVHCDNITGGRGIGLQNQQARVRVYGGKFNNCGSYGMEFISGCTVSVGSLTNDLAGGPVITNCGVAGALFQEGSTGHFDYATVDGMPYGLDIVVNSRVNSTRCAFKNISQTGVRRRLGSYWLNYNNTCTWTNVANKERAYAYSGDTNRTAAAVSQIRTAIDTTQVTHTGTTAETTLKTFGSPTGGAIAADSFDWSGRTQRVIITGQFTGAAGTKTLRVKIGSNLVHGIVSVAASQGFFKYEGVLHATGPSSQAYNAFMQDSSATVVRGDSGTRSINMITGTDQAVTITGQLSIGAESIVIHAVEIWETA